MIHVGTDVAELNYFASAISSDRKELIYPFIFTNNADRLQLLYSHPDSLSDDSFIVVLESTAHYGDNLVGYLVNEGHKICAINQIQASILWKNNSCKTMTDKLNTYIITNTPTRTL